MNARNRASFDFQAPPRAEPPNPDRAGKMAEIASQGPSDGIPDDPVCPFCGKEAEIYHVHCDGHTFRVHRCRVHGDVIPSRNQLQKARRQQLAAWLETHPDFTTQELLAEWHNSSAVAG